MKNVFKKELDAATDARIKARQAAVTACHAANHYPVAEADGYPDWDACFFGETLIALREAEAKEYEAWVKWRNENIRLRVEAKAKAEATKAAAMVG